MKKSVFFLVVSILCLSVLSSCNLESYTKITINFDTNGGSAIDSITYKRDEIITIPNAPTKEGYIFDGWYFDFELTNLVEWPTTSTESLTLYAKWKEHIGDTIVKTIIGQNLDGTVLESNDLEIGTMPVYNGDEPFKQATERLYYVFTGWSPEITVVSENQTYIAVYQEIATAYSGLIDNYAYSFIDSQELPDIEANQGWYAFDDNYLLMIRETNIEIYELSNNQFNLIYSIENDYNQKFISDIEIASNGVVYVLGYHVPKGADSNTYLPGFILEIASDFSSYTFHDLDNVGMRVPHKLAINDKNEFGIIGEGSDPRRAYMQHAFMIFSGDFKREYVYELNGYIRGYYKDIKTRGDSFIVAGMTGNSYGCTNSDCMDPIVQEFNSGDYLLNEINIPYDL